MVDVTALRVDIDPRGARRGATEVNQALNRIRQTSRQSLGSANDNLKRLTRSFDPLKRQLREVNSRYGAFVKIAAAGALVAATKGALSFADSIGKVSDKVGLSTDALQELRFAAEQSGVAQNTLDMAMQRFSRRVGEAAQGSGELKDTLAQYGIAVKNADGSTRALDAVLGDLSDAMAGATSDQERLRIAFKAFDSEGAALVNLLGEGADGMNELRRQAQDLDIVLSEDLVRDAETANDQLNVMSEVVGIRLKSALISLAPAITTAAEGISDLTIAVSDFVNRFRDIDELGTGALRRQVKALESDIISLDKRIAEIGTSEDPLFGAFAETRAGNLSSQRLQAELRLQEARALLEEAEATTSRGRLGGATGGATGGRTSPATPSEFRLLGGAILTPTVPEPIPTLEPFVTEDIGRSLQPVPPLLMASADSAQRLKSSLAEFAPEITAARTEADELHEALETVERAGVGAADVISRSFGELITSGDTFNDTLRRMIRQLSELGVQIFVVDALREAMERLARTDFSGSGSSSGSGGFDIASLFSALGSSSGGSSSGGSGGATSFLGGSSTRTKTGFQHGGEFRVGGAGGTDSQLVSFLASPNEKVIVQTPEQQKQSGGQTISVGGISFAGGLQRQGGMTLGQVEAAVGKRIARAARRNN